MEVTQQQIKNYYINSVIDGMYSARQQVTGHVTADQFLRNFKP